MSTPARFVDGGALVGCGELESAVWSGRAVPEDFQRRLGSTTRGDARGVRSPLTNSASEPWTRSGRTSLSHALGTMSSHAAEQVTAPTPIHTLVHRNV